MGVYQGSLQISELLIHSPFYSPLANARKGYNSLYSSSEQYQIDKYLFYFPPLFFSVFLFFTVETNRLKDKKLSL